MKLRDAIRGVLGRTVNKWSFDDGYDDGFQGRRRLPLYAHGTDRCVYRSGYAKGQKECDEPLSKM